MNIRRRITVFFTLLFSMSTAAIASDVPGKYFLDGKMEIGSILHLRPDGTFSGQIYYGSAGGSANGTWYEENKSVFLKSDSLTVPKPVVVNFDSLSETDLAKAEQLHLRYKDEGFDLARDNYVLTMYYSPPPVFQLLDPVTIYLEYAQGPQAEVQADYFNADAVFVPFDDRRNLKRIGIGRQGHSAAIKWFDVDARSRLFSIGWEKALGRPALFKQLQEYDLSESKANFHGSQEKLSQLKNNYLITLNQNVEFIAPVIEPVEVHWGFQDGTVQKQLWADAKNSVLRLPFDKQKTLKRIGFKGQGSARPIIWVEVTPAGRMFSMEWAEPFVENDSDLSGLFNNMVLDIKPGCLAWDDGNVRGCFRK